MTAASFLQTGTISGWATLLALVVVGYFVVRGGGGQALTILRESNEVLVKKNEELSDVAASQAMRISELERTRTLEPIVSEVAGLAKSIERILSVHEQRAQERHEGQLRAMEAIAGRLEHLDTKKGP